VLVVEQEVILALDTAQRGYALENGRVAMEGRSGELMKNDLFKRIYLGL